ncbi:hypothetical protein CCS92_12555 [Methylobacterium radiotolerans]|nr:hypothetical protein CCS92_12555 [Methylobacterium radiotolerans]
MTASEQTILLALSVRWGGSFFLTRVALSVLPPTTRSARGGNLRPSRCGERRLRLSRMPS